AVEAPGPRGRAERRGRAAPRHVSRAIPQPHPSTLDVDAVVRDQLGHPHAAQLRELLVERHVPQEILDAGVEGRARVAVERGGAHDDLDLAYGAAVPSKYVSALLSAAMPIWSPTRRPVKSSASTWMPPHRRDCPAWS